MAAGRVVGIETPRLAVVAITAEKSDTMQIKASRLKRLLRRKMLVSDRKVFLQSLVSAMNNRTEIRGLTPGAALIHLQSSRWEMYAASGPVRSRNDSGNYRLSQL